MRPLTLAFVVLAVLLAGAASAVAQDGEEPPGEEVVEGEGGIEFPAEDLGPWRVVNVTNGIQFWPPFYSVGVSPTDGDVAYLASRSGRVFVTRDGGASWEEQPALTGRASFVGSIRPTGLPGTPGIDLGAPKNTFEFYPSRVFELVVADAAMLDFSLEDQLTPYPELLTADQWTLRHFDAQLRLPTASVGGSGGGGGGARLGVGLRGGSPWLTLALRKVRKWAVGINIKQTLALRGTPKAWVWWFSVDPRDPNVAFAASAEGLLKTVDGGYSWFVQLTGATALEKSIQHVVRHPTNPDKIFVATGVGVQISEDGGESFAQPPDSRVATYYSHWIEIHPTNPNIVFVGTSSGMFRSDDGGNNYEWVFISPWPPQNQVRKIAADPSDPNRVMLATDDGLFVSRDGGKTFDRAGGFLFVGEPIRALSASGRPGHFIAGDVRDLWETTDGGDTWQVLYFGRIEWDVMMAEFDPSNPDVIWLVNWGEVLKLERTPAPKMTPRAIAGYMSLIDREPTITDAVDTALRRTGVGLAQLNDYRDRASWAAWLPKVAAGGWYRHLTIDGERGSVGLSNTGQEIETFFMGEAPRLESYIAGINLYWDTDNLIFNRDEVPTGRVQRQFQTAEWRVRQTVIVLYTERRRLQLEKFTDRVGDTRTQFLRDLRIEELTAHLNYLTGDLFEFRPALR